MNSDQNGFSLVELLVSIMFIGVLALGMTSLFNSLQYVQAATKYRSMATRSAQREVEVLRNNNYAQLTPGSSLSFSSSLPAELPKGASGTAVVSEPITGLRRVDITVAYTHAGKAQNVKLSSLIGEIGITQ